MFDVATGGGWIAYSDLRVWDATGRELPAGFVEGGRDVFAIVVDDTAAVYPITIDPLTFSTSLIGPQSGAKFGFAVAFYTDGLIVGAPYFDTGALADAGKVFLFLVDGNGVLQTTPAWSVEGEQAYARLGWAVNGEGNPVGWPDQNAGPADVIASAPHFDAPGKSNCGKVYVWKTDGITRIPASTTPDWTAVGSQAGEEFGASVIALQGIQSLMFGAFWSLAVGSPVVGKVTVYYGSDSGLPASPSWVSTGLIPNVLSSSYTFGRSLGWGDVNGDGYGDLIVGAPQAANWYGNYVGVVYVFHGSETGFNTSTYPNQYKVAEPGFGWSVAGVRDVSGDDVDDLVIGSPFINSNRGRAYVYAGGSGIFSVAPLRIWDGQRTGGQFGYSVSGDGWFPAMRNIAVGAPFWDYPGLRTDCGACVIFTCVFGVFSDTAELIFDANQGDQAHAGWSVAVRAGRGDYTINRIAVGAPDADVTGGPTDRGIVTVWEKSP